MDIESHYLLPANLSLVHTSSEPEEVMLASQNPKKKTGRKIFKETRHPIYRGVRSREHGKWVCEVRHPITQSRVWLGTHDTADMAARAHDVAVLALRGPSACLNFADSVWRLPVPKSSDVVDIRKVAAEAAKGFMPIVEIAKNVYDVDEIFGMLGVIDSSMAEGIMLQSPHTLGHGNIFDDVELFEDMQGRNQDLWLREASRDCYTDNKGRS